MILFTSLRSHSLGKKIPPKVPQKPSINALLGIGIVVPQNHGTNSNHGGSNTLPSRSNSTSENIYGKTIAANTMHISHV